MFFAEGQGLGMGVGVIAASVISKMMFAPFMVYSVSKLPQDTLPSLGYSLTLALRGAAINGHEIKNAAT